MIYYSFFNGLDNQVCTEKSYIVKTILEDCYADQISNTDVVIATNEIPVLYGKDHLSIQQIKEKHSQSKIIIFLVDMFYTYRYYDGWFEVNIRDHIEKNLDKLQLANEIWSSEVDVVQICSEHKLNVKHQLLKHSNRFVIADNNLKKNIDVLLYKSIDFYAAKTLQLLIDNKLQICHTDNFEILKKLLPKAKIVLYLPSEQNFYQEQTKIRYLMSNQKCVLSRISKVNYFSGVIEKSDKEIIPTIFWLLENDKWKNYIKELK